MAAPTSPEPPASEHHSEKTIRRNSQDKKVIADDASEKIKIGQDDAKAGSGPQRNEDFLRYDETKWYVDPTGYFRLCGLICHRYQRVPFVNTNPEPPLVSIDDAGLIPEATATWFSKLAFDWITPTLSLGYARPLEPPDLWKLQESRSAHVMSNRILENFEQRKAQADAYNERLRSGQIKPGLRAIWWALKGDKAKREQEWREKSGLKKPSLMWTMNDSIKWWFWSGGVCVLISNVAQICSPLLVKVGDFIRTDQCKLSTNSYSGDHQVWPRIICWAPYWGPCAAPQSWGCYGCRIVPTPSCIRIEYPSRFLP